MRMLHLILVELISWSYFGESWLIIDFWGKGAWLLIDDMLLFLLQTLSKMAFRVIVLQSFKHVCLNLLLLSLTIVMTFIYFEVHDAWVERGSWKFAMKKALGQMRHGTSFSSDIWVLRRTRNELILYETSSVDGSLMGLLILQLLTFVA